MKSYQAFLDSLTAAHFVQIAEAVNHEQISASLPLSSETAKQTATSLGAVSCIVTLELLKLYHEWLHRAE